MANIDLSSYSDKKLVATKAAIVLRSKDDPRAKTLLDLIQRESNKRGLRNSKGYDMDLKNKKIAVLKSNASAKVKLAAVKRLDNECGSKDNDTDKAIKLLEKLDTLLNTAKGISSEIVEASRFGAGPNMTPLISKITTSSKAIIDAMGKVKSGR